MPRSKEDILREISDLRSERNIKLRELEQNSSAIFKEYDEPLNKLYQELIDATELVGKHYKYNHPNGLVIIGRIDNMERYRCYGKPESLKINGPTFVYQIPEEADGYCEISGKKNEDYLNIIINETILKDQSKIQVISEYEAKKLIEEYTEDTLLRILKMF